MRGTGPNIGGCGPTGRAWRALCAAATILAAILALTVAPVPASAATFQYSNTTTGAINNNGNSCSGQLVRSFTVGTSYAVGDVNLGVLISHNSRRDLRLTLISPAGTSVEVMRNSGGFADNLNVDFDDEAATNISTHTVNDTTGGAPPPYASSFIPRSALSAFDGENASGTWTLQICDSRAGTTGNFLRADLSITEAPPFADLSLTKTVSNASPASGAAISYTLTVTNSASSFLTATGVTVQDSLPLGVSLVSATGTGSYNSGTGVWTVGDLAVGASASLTINFTVDASAGATVTNSAEVSTSSAFDNDSTPGNGATGEDDTASASFTVAGTRTAGTPPTLTCPAGTTVLDWNAQSWTSGSLTGNASVANVGTINASVASGGTFLSPLALTNNNTGGLASTEVSLYELLDHPNQGAVTTTTFVLPTAVPGLKFTVFDIDFAAGQFADKLTVTGSFNGVPVTPTLTNGIVNFVIGNVAIGDGGAGNTSASGNVVVTFLTPVDTVVVSYGNHTTAPTNPGQQGISIHDFTLCNPVADISVTKLSSVLSDGISITNPFSVPGATMRYCVLVTNNGSGTATALTTTDAVPANVTYVAGSLRSGTNCATATTVEDDDASGADESDPFGMSVSGTTVSGTASSLAPSASFAMVFHATVN